MIEISVYAFAKLVARHHDSAAEHAVGVKQLDQLGALGRRQERGGQRVTIAVQLRADRRPAGPGRLGSGPVMP